MLTLEQKARFILNRLESLASTTYDMELARELDKNMDRIKPLLQQLISEAVQIGFNRKALRNSIAAALMLMYLHGVEDGQNLALEEMFAEKVK